MATIIKNIKDGKVISYKFRSCLGRDDMGKQISRYTTWHKINKTNKGELTPDGVNSCGQKPAASKKKWWRDERDKPKPFETTAEFVERIRRSF
ncbi:MAG: hypothetical protein PHD32_00235 [Eubacteriales bacterium]|nr:hypothetical protein [Eubacteriales bacterium]